MTAQGNAIGRWWRRFAPGRPGNSSPTPGPGEPVANGPAGAGDAAHAETEVPSWRAVLDAVPAHVVVIDARGTIVGTNRTWVEFARANHFAGDPTAGNYLAVCDRATGRGAEEARRMATAIRAVAAGTRETFAMRYACHAPHQARWFTAHVGRCGAHLVIAHEEVTAEMLAAQSLRRSEERFRCVVEYSPEVVAILDTHGRITYISPNVSTVTGRSTAEVTGHSIFDFLHPDDAGPARERLADLVAGRSMVVELAPIRLRDTRGEWRWIEAVARNLLAVPAVSGVMVNFRDVSAHVHAEERLQASERRLQLALAVAHAGAWEYDIATGEAFWSDESYALLGYEPGRVRPSFDAWLARVHPDDREQVGREAERLLADPTAFTMDLRVQLPDGTIRWLSSVGRVVERDADGHVRRLLGMQIDVTERKNAEDAVRALNAELERRVAERTAALARSNADLARATRMKDEFLASLTHELRTPLAVILGSAAALAEGAYGPVGPAQADVLATLQTSGTALRVLINDLLDLAHLGAGSLELDRAAVAPAPLCAHALRAVAGEAAVRRLTLHADVPDDLPAVWADERRLTQVLAQLFGNALKFTADGGEIGIEARLDAEPGAVEITVWDSGIGIAEADMPVLFAPFVQLDAGLSRRFPGTGLGLHLVRRLIALHGGSVRLESIAGRGSRFSIRLPLASVTAREPLAPPPAPAQGPTVLLADDDAEACEALREALAARGCRVIWAADATAALAEAAAQPPDAVVLDLQLPGGGLDLAGPLRGAAAVPLLVVASLAVPGDRERCIAAGAAELLLKPVAAAVLAERLVRLLAASPR